MTKEIKGKENLMLAQDFIKVEKNGKFGFIDTAGKQICKCIYDEAEDFANGYARVKRNGNWSFIDATGRKICEFRYAKVEDFANGFAYVFKQFKINLKWRKSRKKHTKNCG